MKIDDRATSESKPSDSPLLRTHTLMPKLAILTLAIVALLTISCARADAPVVVASATQSTQNPTSTVAPEPTKISPAATSVPSATATNTPQPTSTSVPPQAPTSTATPTTQATATTAAPTSTSTAPAPAQPTNTPAPTLPTPTTAPQPTATPPPIATATAVEPTPTPGIVINQERADEGEAIYSSNCSGCHSRGPNKIVGPGHENVYETAKTRVAGLSADGYIMQSITDSTAFVVPGFSPIMPSFSFFSDEQILALLEFLKTL